eukprot:9399888-Alexandrium_andersonii.AAC.1
MAKDCADCGLADCGLEVALPRFRTVGPPEAPFSSADSEISTNRRRRTHPPGVSGTYFEVVLGPAQFKFRTPEA